MLAKINNIQHQRSGNFFLISGPCVIESKQHAMDVAGTINDICSLLNINFIYISITGEDFV